MAFFDDLETRSSDQRSTENAALLKDILNLAVKFDGYKANPKYALSCIKAAYDQGARWVILCDTNGGTLPHEVTQIVGEVTSGSYGHRVGSSIALGMIRAELAIPNQEVMIDIFGQSFKAIVHGSGPLWDSENRSLRS